MSISSRISSYLEQRGVHYDVCSHIRSRTSAQSARTAHIRLNELAKSVILEDDGGFVMAVVPADCKVRLGEVSRLLGRQNLHLADEERLTELFKDCERGAVPALGMAWGIETVVDDDLDSSEVVYIEGGDHERLVRIIDHQFHEIMLTARHGHFCKRPTH